MLYPDEHESQIELPLHSRHDNLQSPPRVSRSSLEADNNNEKQVRGHNEGPDSDDTISETENGKASNEVLEPDVADSVVRDAQFVDVETDNQATDRFNSPNTWRALKNIESKLLAVPAPSLITPFVGIQRPKLPDEALEFRYAIPPNPNNMILTRPIPGQPSSVRPPKALLSDQIEQEAIVLVPSNITRSLSGKGLPVRGGLQQDIHTLKKQLHVMSSFQSVPTSISDAQAIIQNPDDVVPTQNSHRQTDIDISAFRARSVKGASRSSSLTRPPFDDIPLPVLGIVHVENALRPPRAQRSAKTELPIIPLNGVRNAGTSTPPATEEASIDSRDPMVTEIEQMEPHTGNVACLEERRDGLKPVKFQTQISSGTSLIAVIKPSMPPFTSVDDAPRGKTDSNDGPNICNDSAGEVTAISENQELRITRNSGDTEQPTNSDNPIYISEIEQNVQDGPINTGERPPNRAVKKVKTNRPLQAQSVHQTQILHDVRGSKVTRKTSSKTSSGNITGLADQPSVASITAIEMLQMAMIQANAEKAQQDASSVVVRHQEAQLLSLEDERAAMMDKIRLLTAANIELVSKVTDFQEKSDRYRLHINEVVRAQKQLDKEAKSLRARNIANLKERAQELNRSHNEALERMEKDQASFVSKTQETLREARAALASQGAMIDVLRSDLNNRLLDLQRERSKSELLQKQLDDRSKLHQELKDLLCVHSVDTATQLANHTDKFPDILNALTRHQTSLENCSAMIKAVKDSEPKPPPELEDLAQLIMTLSRSIESRLRESEDNIDMRKANTEMLAELEKRLSALNEEHKEQKDLNNRISKLNEENVRLDERLRARDSDVSQLMDRIIEIKRDGETCRGQLITVREELGKALITARDNLFLNNQLTDLQDRCTQLKEQVISSNREAEQARTDLLVQENFSLGTQEQIIELKAELQQNESKVAAFRTEKESYTQQLKDESDALRIEMERGFQSRLEDDAAHHFGIISSLRRQKFDNEAKLAEKQEELDKLTQVRRGDVIAGNNLRVEITNLETRMGHQAIELGLVEEKIRSKDQSQDSVAGEAQVLRNQLSECEREIREWRARVEEIASQFAQNNEERSEEIRMSGAMAESEVDRLKDKLVEIHKRDTEFQTTKNTVAGYLRGCGLLGPKTTLEDWALQLVQEQEFGNITPSRLLRITKISEINGPSQEVSACFADDTTGTSGDTNNFSNMDSAKMIESSSTEASENSSYPNNKEVGGFCDKDDEERLLLRRQLFSSSRTSNPAREDGSHDTIPTSNKFSGKEYSKNEPNTGARLLQSPNAKTVAGHQSFSTEAIHQSLLAPGVSKSVNHNIPRNQKIINLTGRTTIPDSQEKLSLEQPPVFVQPPRKIAQRRRGIPASPSALESNRTVTMTEVTEYSMITSKTYENASENPRARSNSIAPGKLESSSQMVVPAGEESPLSSPLSDVDFNEFLEDYEEKVRSRPLRPQANVVARSDGNTGNLLQPSTLPSSNVSPLTKSKEPKRPQDVKPPKSILKRRRSLIHTSETVIQSQPKDMQSLGVLQTSQIQNRHVATGANKRLSRPNTRVDGLEGPSYNLPYNRIVSGTKQNDVLEVRGTRRQAPVNPHQDAFTIESSPMLEQPQRNAKKRSLSGVSVEDGQKVNKIPRKQRHY